MTLVSILLPVYNTERYIGRTISSLLGQTYKDIEIIVINDGSTDNTEKEILALKDARVKYYAQENQGLSRTPNRAFSLSSGEYIARMDADDLAFPEKIEKQVRYLESHPDVDMVGTWAEIWQGDTKTARAHRHPTEDRMIKTEMLFNNPFVHSTVLMRREVFAAIGGYSESPEDYPEDYEFLVRITERFRVANIPEILNVYRELPDSVCRKDARGPRKIPRGLARIAARNIARLVGGTVARERVFSFTHAIHKVSLNDMGDDSPACYDRIAKEIYHAFVRTYGAEGLMRLKIARRIGQYLFKAYANFYRKRI